MERRERATPFGPAERQPPSAPDPEVLRAAVAAALAEDVGPGDLTTELVVPATQRARGRIVAGEAGVVAGLPVAAAVFAQLDAGCAFTPLVDEGARVAPDQAVAEVAGPARALLAGERVALNFLQRLSGIATLTARFVAQVAGTGCRVLDTRKTAPGLRALDKYAVRVGGGLNHRRGLFDGILIKDNHVLAAGGIRAAVERARRGAPPLLRVEVEVGTLDEVREALDAGADMLLLDNMPVPVIREAVRIVAGRVPLEASGGIRLETARAVAEAGVDYISVGALTHSAPALDLRLDLELELGRPDPERPEEGGAA